MELNKIKGIGPKAIELLNKLNIWDSTDLLSYFPYRYAIYQPIDLNIENPETNITINATIVATPKLSYIRKNFNRLSFQAMTSNLIIKVSIFNRSFLYPNLEIGKEITLVGKYDNLKNTFVASELKFGHMKETKIEPIYHTIKGLKNKSIANFIQNAFLIEKEYIDYIPSSILEKYQFLKKEEALQAIHHPQKIQILKQAKIRLIYEEFFVFMLKINYLKRKREQEMGIAKHFEMEQITEIIQSLPFELTSDQQKAIFDCLEDMKSTKQMNRLIQGDVGSGKTIVAIIVMYACCRAGFQSALMAPTEIVANQHFENVKKILSPYLIRIALLTGKSSKKEHDEIVSKLKQGEIDMIIGTHALLNENVEFKNLGLVITDEQHRFGVKQRKNLQNKGTSPDIIYMSATPIPRTYALTIYQDMDTSIIKTKPQGRKEIKTFVKKEQELKSVLHHLLEEVKKGHQIYVVAPAILEEENKTLHDVETLKEDFEKAFCKKVPIAILHGKIKAKEKDRIMKEFQEGKTKILIATTVIEVGVDVQNATTIVIFNAEMYGLATLHQLRGRVGRNHLDSFCYLISNQNCERLKVLEESNDGFYISEQDFLMRREGELFGTKQSGDMAFKIADLRKDFKILLQAKEDSQAFLLTTGINEEKYTKIINEVKNND